MKIGTAANNPITEALARSAVANGAERVSGGSENPTVQKVEAVETTDSLRLSQATRKLAAEGRGGSPVREDKVAEIRQAIDEGRFRVNAEAVADRMLSEAGDMVRTLLPNR